MRRGKMPLLDRWRAKAIPQEDGCWLWSGAKNASGYGIIGVGSRSDGTRKSAIASRVAYELHCGPIPEGMYVCHTCDNPPCVNPEHLFIGTNRDNIHDSIAKGRSAIGRRSCSHGFSGPGKCRDCLRERSARYYQANREAITAHKRAEYQKQKATATREMEETH